MCIALTCLMVQDQKKAPCPCLFRYLQHISGLSATGTINHPLTLGWSAGRWGDPRWLFADRLLNCLKRGDTADIRFTSAGLRSFGLA